MIEFSGFLGVSREDEPSAEALLKFLLPPCFLNTPRVQVSHKVKSRFKGWKNRLHTWMGIVTKSHCKGRGCMQERTELLWSLLQIISQGPVAVWDSSPCKESLLPLAGSVTGLVGLHVSCFSSGKMKRFGGDKGKDVKCFKLPEGIVSITFPYLYKNKITHICISDMYVYTQRNYVYTHTYCILLITTHASAESGHLFFCMWKQCW